MQKIFLIARTVLLLPAWSSRFEDSNRVLRTPDAKYFMEDFFLGLRVFQAGVLLPNRLCADLHWKVITVVSGLVFMGLVDNNLLGDGASQALV